MKLRNDWSMFNFMNMNKAPVAKSEDKTHNTNEAMERCVSKSTQKKIEA